MLRDIFEERVQMQEEQLGRLNTLLAAVRENEFYKKRMDEKFLTEDFQNVKDISTAFPLLSKDDIAEDHATFPPFGSNLSYPLEKYNHFNQTSGTTSTPIRWVDDEDSWQWMVDNWKVVLDLADLKKGDRAMFAFSFGPFLGFWSAFDAVRAQGALIIPGGGMTTIARLHCIMDNNIDTLFCTPTYAMRMGEIAKEEKFDLSKSPIKKIILAGEPGGSISATRARILKVWPNAELYDHHGMTEVGPVSYQCPKHTGSLHIISSSYYAEVIDPESGSKVQPGFVGELVLTTLGRLGSPAIRYRTGDYVMRGDRGKCDCGTFDLKLEGGILGRIDNMIFVRGVNIYPAAVEELIRKYSEIVEYRVEFKSRRSMTEMNVKIECDESTAKPQKIAKALQMDMRTAFTLRIPVTLVDPGELPRFEAKAKRWIRL
ncbi:MAG: AMP-binding protein [Lentisphaeraceae bacterium]|nr:AMP-binding protein [Lentisphaeraceae bacterium]